jgi:hypothetical protein
VDLHPYDGKERRFRYDDATCENGRAIVAKIMQLPVAPRGALFDMTFYSGGVGIFDRVAIAFAATHDDAVQIACALAFVAADAGDGALGWFVGDELPVAAELARFIAERRHGFQPDYADGDPLWFEAGSDIDHWAVAWHSGGMLAYLGYDQG